MKILIMNPMDVGGAEQIKRKTPDLFFTQNGEEVLALVKQGKVSRVCIVWGAVCFSEYEMSAAIHGINPDIPILIMSSYLPEKSSPQEFVTTDAGFFFETVNEFLNGEFTASDYKLFPKEKYG